MPRAEVASVDEVPADQAKLVRVSGVEILLFRVGDGFRAYRNACPHANAPLNTGRVSNGVLRCPWHGWEFNLSTGAHVRVASCTLDAYTVEVEGGRLFVTTA